MKKKGLWVAIMILLMLAAGGLYAWEIFVKGVPYNESLMKVVLLEASFCLSIARLLRGQTNEKPLSFYEKQYAEEIGAAFDGQPKAKQELLQGIRFFNEDRFKKAEKKLRKAEEQAESWQSRQVARLFMALNYEGAGNIAGAIRTYEQIVRENPVHHQALSNLGLLYMKQGQYADAKRSYEKAIAANPGYAEAHLNLAMLCFREGDLEPAIKEARLALERKPTLRQAASLLAVLYAVHYDEETSKKYIHIAVTHGEDRKALEQTIRNYIES